jgi:hypothetical protein
MYPNGENARGQFGPLSPDTLFKDGIKARETV